MQNIVKHAVRHSFSFFLRYIRPLYSFSNLWKEPCWYKWISNVVIFYIYSKTTPKYGPPRFYDHLFLV